MFIAMPSRKVSEGVYDDIAHPVNQETRQMFEDAIFKAYDEMKNTGEELVKIDL
jgi:stage V sporulation protein G